MKDKKKVITSKKWYNIANYSHLLDKNVVYNGIEYKVVNVPHMLNDYYELNSVKGNQTVHVPESEFESKVTLLP